MRHSKWLTAVAATASMALLGPSASAMVYPDPGYQFSSVQTDGLTPVGMVCESHPVQVNLGDSGDPTLLPAALRAISRVAAATGLNLYYAGATRTEWNSAMPSIFALASTTPPAATLSFEPGPNLGNRDDLIGLTAAPEVTSGGHKRISWFRTAINYDYYDRVRTASGQAEADRELYTTLIHELGHGVGLAHTTVQTEVMFYADAPWLTDFNAGDLTGLNIVGHVNCPVGAVAPPTGQTRPAKKAKSKKFKKHHKKKKRHPKKKRKQVRKHAATLPVDPNHLPSVVWHVYE